MGEEDRGGLPNLDPNLSKNRGDLDRSHVKLMLIFLYKISLVAIRLMIKRFENRLKVAMSKLLKTNFSITTLQIY